MTNNDQDAARGRKNIKCLASDWVRSLWRVSAPMPLQPPLPSPSNLTHKLPSKTLNFGHFKFQNNTASISYVGTLIGEATIVKARARARSTKKVNVTSVASSGKVSSNSQLGDDIESGIIPLGSHARLDGKIILFKVFKKKKSAEMNCIMDVNTTTKEIQNLKCK
ncbi:hypothetical protein SLEP1_g3388 [Rubroshorea leprosula]|uniref:Late embryogenesis abundant protein LEA-2 subgroup domain-containing protein n=1 Tax=Rubroshorea leprosula TaxID=152421 RepID=A0AAV5HU00_9ROSI|nr:hypothetical protein SLEP1_g3388 [Rubroshorea leprosula]